MDIISYMPRTPSILLLSPPPRVSLGAAFALSVHSVTPDNSERKDIADHPEDTRVIASGLGMRVLPLTDPASGAGSLVPLFDRILEKHSTARPKFDALYPKRCDAADMAGWTAGVAATVLAPPETVALVRLRDCVRGLPCGYQHGARAV
jgi:hypothetical protein